MALAPETGAHVAQTIGPATDGCRTIVLTVDDGDGAATGAAADSSILDGGLDATWVVPTRDRRFARGAGGSAPVAEAAADQTATATAAAPAEAAPVDAAPADVAPRRRTAVEPRFHAGGDDAAIARVAAERQAAERRHAERRRRAAEAKAPAPARRRSGPAAAALAVPALVERHTVRITGTPDPRLTGPALVPAAGPSERRHSLSSALNPVAGLLDRPDRLAMWAVLLGIFLVLVAATSG